MAIDQQSRNSCGSGSGRIRLSLTEKGRTPGTTVALDVHPEREQSPMARWAIAASLRDGFTDPVDRYEA